MAKKERKATHTCTLRASCRITVGTTSLKTDNDFYRQLEVGTSRFWLMLWAVRKFYTLRQKMQMQSLQHLEFDLSYVCKLQTLNDFKFESCLDKVLLHHKTSWAADWPQNLMMIKNTNGLMLWAADGGWLHQNLFLSGRHSSVASGQTHSLPLLAKTFTCETRRELLVLLLSQQQGRQSSSNTWP